MQTRWRRLCSVRHHMLNHDFRSPICATRSVTWLWVCLEALIPTNYCGQLSYSDPPSLTSVLTHSLPSVTPSRLLVRFRSQFRSKLLLFAMTTVDFHAFQESWPKFDFHTMGSFSSSPKILNDDTQDNDICLPENMTKDELLRYCSSQLQGASVLSRRFRSVPDYHDATYKNQDLPQVKDPSSIRILQWNLLSQTLGVNNDNFVCCPPEALQWQRRRNLLTQEIVRYSPDVICLQEVDHFNYLKKVLGTQGYVGMFFPKPDSPCMYVNDNNGPDGCAIFFRTSRFELVKHASRVLEVWKVQSNQVALLAILRNRADGKEICIATTHLKARNGALLAALRNEQGKDLLDFVAAAAQDRPVVLCGDFNAEPIEPIYTSVTTHPSIRLASAYATCEGEPPYTTWKVREEGEVRHTIDYIFYSKNKFQVEDVLEFPTGEEMGPGRVPSFNYPSDHFSLVSDLHLNHNVLSPL